MLLPDITITRVSDEGAGPIRRALNSAFQPKALQQQEPMILSHIQRLLAQLRRETSSGNAVDIRKWIIFSLFDINSDFVFDEDLGCVEAGKFHEWVEFVTEFFFASTLLHQCYKFAPLQKLLALCIPRSTKERQVKHDEASLMRVRRRMAKQTDKLDFTHHFVKNAEKEGLSLPTIEAQFSVVILAGSESTAVAVNGAIFSVLSNAAVYEKLKKEIRETFETAEDIQLQTIQRKLPYLDAVVQETLRMHPPFANGFTRVVPPGQGGAMISGQWVPPDVSAVVDLVRNLKRSD
jgi:cytochrome P450